MADRPRRSALYMPASNARALEKARTLAADVVILDLEDAVAPEAKAEARLQAVEAVRAGGFGRREVVIRVNALDGPWGAEDLAAAVQAAPDAVLVPKLGSVQELRAYEAALAQAPFHVALWGMIETTRAIFALGDLATASVGGRMAVWVVGTNDLAKEMGCRLTPDRAPLWGPLSLTVAAARMGGLSVLDGVYNDLDDDAGLAAACEQAVAFGFDGKTLVHPRQIDLCNRAFTPSDEEAEAARRVVAAFDAPENQGRGALRVDGRMVERLHYDMARRLLKRVEAMAD